MKTVKYISEDYDTIYGDSLIDQACKLASRYWKDNRVYERWFLSRLETVTENNKNAEDRLVTFRIWLENVMYFFTVRKIVEKYDESRGAFSTYVYNTIKYYECIFAYQILYNLTQSEALAYTRKLANKEDKEIDLDLRNRKSILCAHSSFDEVVKERKSGSKDVTLGEVVEDRQNIDPQKRLEIEEKLRAINEVLESNLIKPNQRNIIKSYIQNNCNYADTAKCLGLTRQRIEQVMKHFRTILKQKGISYKD